MGKKWWYQRGLQTQLLLVILCLTPYALAAQHVSGTTKKGKTGTTIKSTKPVPPQSPRLSRHGRGEKTSTVKTRKSSHLTKAAPPPQKKHTVRSASKSQHRTSKRTERRNPHKLVAKSTTKNRRIFVLKETKNHKLVKTVVTVPRSRMTARSKFRQKTISTTPKEVTASRSLPFPITTPEQSTALPVSPPLSSIFPQENHTSTGSALTAVRKLDQESTEDSQQSYSWPGYSPGRARFTVQLNDEQMLHRLNSAFVLPGDEIFIEIADRHKNLDYTFRTTLGKERQLGVNRWYWHAPSRPGVYPVKIQQTRSGETVTLNVFVMIPLNQVEDGTLNGYRIGHYPSVALRQQPIYTPPRGFIEVTPDIENMLVSPHFRLRQFLCKQEGGYPKYLILDVRLLVALELLLEKANARGYRARTFTVMSGYRTPYYNRAIGNSTTYSRHLWGDAADIFIDENPPDGQMDDLNQDGEIDSHDAEVLYDLIESEYESRFQRLLVGGLARYRETSSHGPFVHVDVRGVAVRWGAKSPPKGFSSPTIPVTLRNGAASRAYQPSYWNSETETDSAP
jgi:hypothetical protein